MASPFSSQHLASIRDDTRHLVARMRDHEDHRHGRGRTAEGVAHQASALSVHLPVRHRFEWEAS